MKRSILVLVVVVSLASANAWADLYNEIIDLGTLPGGLFSTASAINDVGQVVGNARTANGKQHAFLWDRNNGMTDLGTLGGDSSAATGVNNLGQVVGFSKNASGEDHAFQWDSTNGMIDLGTLTGTGYSEARAINDSGQVVGYYSPSRAFLWEAGVMIDIGDLGGTSSIAKAINNLGQVAGQSSRFVGSGDYGFIWDNGVMTDLGTSVPCDVFGLNNLGQVVGSMSYPYGSDAFIWDNGVITTLPTYGGISNRAIAINDVGQVVGRASNSSWDANYNAVLWDNGNIISLNTIAQGFGWDRAQSASDINNNGYIVGYGYVNGEAHGFLLEPVPVPSAFILGSLGLTFSGWLLKRKRMI